MKIPPTGRAVHASQANESKPIDFGDIRGQEAAKRALTIALLGEHSVTLYGPSGWGKSMLYLATKAIQPDLAILELTTDPKSPTDRFKDKSGSGWWALDDLTAYIETDIQIEVPAVPFREFVGHLRGTDTAAVKKAINFKVAKDLRTGEFPRSVTLSELSESCKDLLKHAVDELGLSGRSIRSIVRVANTIAALDKSFGTINEVHIAEAVQYRRLDRRF